MRQVAAERTRYIVCVLEDLYDPRNSSAVIRHCDALGIQDVHAIENQNQFKSDDQVSLGSTQWIKLHRHRKTKNNSAPALTELQNQGFRIIATTPQTGNTVLPETLDLASGPVAVIFGTEKHGISQIVRDKADSFLSIPMVGFVDSLNISASASIVLYTLAQRIRREKLPWKLNKDDRERLIHDWINCGTPPRRCFD